jgi:hypothetical protein
MSLFTFENELGGGLWTVLRRYTIGFLLSLPTPCQAVEVLGNTEFNLIERIEILEI